MDLEKIIGLLVEKGHLSKEAVPNILEDADFKKKRKERKKKTSEERRGHYDSEKCQARVWKDGYDNIQCSFSKQENGCMCKKHQGCVDKEGTWWLGKITDPRPEKPNWRGVDHVWKTDENGNEIVDEKEKDDLTKTENNPPKKKRGRPKGSKNKKKVDTKKDLTIEEITALLEQKKKEKEEKEKMEEKDGDVEEEKKEEEISIYKVDGVPYELSGEEIMDPEDFSPIGKIDGKGGIIFEDEEAEETHKKNIDKYA